MYDKFKPFNKIKGLNFTFIPERYELWKNGQCSANFIKIEFKVSQDETSNRVTVITSKNNLNLSERLEFDISYTSGDRIYCATVPNKTNINSSDAFLSFKANVPIGFNIITRENKYFEENEPYICSIYLINGRVSKISFSFENNPRLLEFYARGVSE